MLQESQKAAVFLLVCYGHLAGEIPTGLSLSQGWSSLGLPHFRAMHPIFLLSFTTAFGNGPVPFLHGSAL